MRVGVASAPAEALQRTEELRPEIVLVDIMLAGESGFELARRLVERDRDGAPAVILISTHAEADFADLIAESQAAGFLPTSELSADAIRRIVDGTSRRARTDRSRRPAHFPGQPEAGDLTQALPSRRAWGYRRPYEFAGRRRRYRPNRRHGAGP
jgi:DNA-binding NarL/FixJ family response regulator